MSPGNKMTQRWKAWLWPEMPMRVQLLMQNQVTVAATSNVESPTWQPSTQPQDPCLLGSPRNRVRK